LIDYFQENNGNKAGNENNIHMTAVLGNKHTFIWYDDLTKKEMDNKAEFLISDIDLVNSKTNKIGLIY
jgi:hypothetical protein